MEVSGEFRTSTVTIILGDNVSRVCRLQDMSPSLCIMTLFQDSRTVWREPRRHDSWMDAPLKEVTPGPPH
jgi:hypothetical protein